MRFSAILLHSYRHCVWNLDILKCTFFLLLFPLLLIWKRAFLLFFMNLFISFALHERKSTETKRMENWLLMKSREKISLYIRWPCAVCKNMGKVASLCLLTQQKSFIYARIFQALENDFWIRCWIQLKHKISKVKYEIRAFSRAQSFSVRAIITCYNSTYFKIVQIPLKQIGHVLKVAIH